MVIAAPEPISSMPRVLATEAVVNCPADIVVVPVTIDSRPPFTVKLPVLVFAPLRVSEPVPVLVRPSPNAPPFCSVPLKLVLLLSPPTVIVRALAVPPFSTVPAPAREPMVASKLFRRRIPAAWMTCAEALLKPWAMPACRTPSATVVEPE